MYRNEHIDYTNYLRDKPLETDTVKIYAMKKKLAQALKEQEIQFHDLSCEFYKDGCIRVTINGEYYYMFNSNTGMFFSGEVGD